MQGRLFIRRRYAHQALYIERPFLAATPQELVGVAGRDARLLRFLACVHLNEQARQPLSGASCFDEGFRQPGPIERVKDIEEFERLVQLVGLQGTDQMEFQIGKSLPQGWPFPRCFLDTVFAKDTLPFGQQGKNIVLVESLGDGDKNHVFRSTAGLNGCGRNTRANEREAMARRQDVLIGVLTGHWDIL